MFRYKGFRFFFYSNEGDPREPVHVHARGDGGEAKFWLSRRTEAPMQLRRVGGSSQADAALLHGGFALA